jgi:ATP-dependent DNA helicase DinG
MEWSEKEQKPVPILNHKCVDVSSEFRQILTRQAALLASGTVPLTLGRRLGISDAPLSDVGSPFDYSKSHIVFSNLSGKFGLNNDYERACQVADAINATVTKGVDGEQGGTLVLFSSWRDLENVMEVVISKLVPGVPVLAQSRTDQRDTAQMIEEFRSHGKAVLCGVQSLWTGIDIPGSALKQVILYKVPYPVPTVESKAIEAVHGRNVYTDNMMQLLVQGIGRLIRTTSDSGRIFIADSRARTLRWTSNPMSKHVAQFRQ